MGTTRSGLYLHTQGSNTQVSQYALVHSVEGTFTSNHKRLLSGGHGQANIDLLDKLGQKYEINHTYPNGVRYGNVLKHKDRKKREDNGQVWFPKNWTASDIKRAGKYVANLKSNLNKPDGSVLLGTYAGVVVGVIKTNGKIATIFPNKLQ